jgi:hypothetical protein
MKRGLSITYCAVMLLRSASVLATEQVEAVPPPLRVYIPFEAAWRGMCDTFREQELKVFEEDRGQGILTSDFIEYTSGVLTKSHIAKIGQRPEVTDGDWVRVEYRYEVLIELIEAKETVVTVDARIRALKRDFLGTESWVKIPSNGQRERFLLNEFGKLLFGQLFSLTKSGGMWKLEPNYVPDMSTRVPITNRDKP